MGNKLTLDHITKGLQVLEKIRYVSGVKLREDSEKSIKADNLSFIRDAILTIADLFPDTNRGKFSQAVHNSHGYSIAYRDMKRQFGGIRKQKANINQIADIIKTILPVLDNRNKTNIEKLVKVYEILSK